MTGHTIYPPPLPNREIPQETPEETLAHRESHRAETLGISCASHGSQFVRSISLSVYQSIRWNIIPFSVAGIYDSGSHTYQNVQTERTRIWYGPGGYAYVYQIYGTYFCLGIITELQGIPGAVLVRALELIDDKDHLPVKNAGKQTP